jgi:hypothetical protein
MFFNWRNKSLTTGWFVLYVLSLAMYISILFFYFNYWNYEFMADREHGFSPSFLIGFMVLFLLFLVFILIKKKYFLLLFIPLGIFVLQIGHMWMIGTFPDEKFALQNDPRWMLVLLGTLGYLLFLRNRGVKIIVFPMVVSTLVFLVFSFITADSLYGKIKFWRKRQKETAFVWKYAANFDRSQRVFTDYQTHQAFLGTPHMFCFERLSCTFDKSVRRFYPQNADKVRELLQKNTRMMMSKRSLNNYEQLLSDKKYIVEQENENYIALIITSNE